MNEEYYFRKVFFFFYFERMLKWHLFKVKKEAFVLLTLSFDKRF